jgi:BlaI family penicillinase repressor
MERGKSISRSEWEVLNVLWDHPNATAREVCAILAPTKSWNSKTVGTFLTRLADKGAVAVRKDGPLHRYRARQSREASITRESASFLRRIFRGAVGPMLAHFCEQVDLSPEEIARLEKILQRKKK